MIDHLPLDDCISTYNYDREFGYTIFSFLGLRKDSCAKIVLLLLQTFFQLQKERQTAC